MKGANRRTNRRKQHKEVEKNRKNVPVIYWKRGNSQGEGGKPPQKTPPRRKKKDRRDDGGGYPSRGPPSTLLNVKATVFLEVFCFYFKNFVKFEKNFEFKSFNSKLEIVLQTKNFC